MKTLAVLVAVSIAYFGGERLATAQNQPDYDAGQLLDSANEFIKQAYRPETSAVGRVIGKSLHVGQVARVFPRGQRVDAWVVQNSDGRIEGVYPFKPEIIHGSHKSQLEQVTLTGTGEWAHKRPTTIGPAPVNSVERMKNWDKVVRDAGRGEITPQQRQAFAEVFSRGSGGLQPTIKLQVHKGTAPKGVKIHFDDRVLAQIVSRPGDAQTVEALARLGNSLLGAATAEKVNAILRDFVNEQKARLAAKSPRLDIRNGVVVSLGAVLNAVRKSSDSIEGMPSQVRSLGGITRLHGFVLFPQSDDIVLFGTVDAGLEPIGLDNLVIALRSVFKSEVVPEVSLDPDLANPRGPQQARVYGVPHRSHFARIMLEADYAMKRITMGDPTERFALPGFRTLKDLFEQDSSPLNARFWFSPIPLREGDIHLSYDGDVALFDTGVRLQTETMQLANSGLVGLGKVDSRAEVIAQAFTDRYAEIVRSRPIFRQLHGLFDVVLMSKLFQRLGVQSKTLDGLVSLVVPEIEVPTAYPGVTVVVSSKGQRIGELSGGVSVRNRVGNRQALHYDTPAVEKLRALSSRLVQQRSIVASVGDLTLAVPKAQTGPNTPVDADISFAFGLSALGRRDYRAAADAFTKAIDADNEFGEAYVMRSHARWDLGDLRSAREDLDKAIELAPDDADLKVIRSVLLVRMGKLPSEIALDDVTRGAVANLYYEEARTRRFVEGNAEAALTAVGTALQFDGKHVGARRLRAVVRMERKDYKAAFDDIKDAMRLDPRSGENYQIRGVIRMESGDEEGAFDDFTEAIKRDPEAPSNYFNRARLLQKWGNTKDSEKDVAIYHALEINRYTALIKKDPTNPALFVRRGVTKRAFGKVKGAIEDFTAATKLDPRIAVAYAERASARHTLEEYQQALSDASRAIQLESGYAYAYALRGAANYKLQRPEDAIRDATTAIQKEAGLAYAYHIRALAREARREYEPAIKDWTEAMRLDPTERRMYQQLIDAAKREQQQK